MQTIIICTKCAGRLVEFAIVRAGGCSGERVGSLLTLAFGDALSAQESLHSVMLAEDIGPPE